MPIVSEREYRYCRICICPSFYGRDDIVDGKAEAEVSLFEANPAARALGQAEWEKLPFWKKWQDVPFREATIHDTERRMFSWGEIEIDFRLGPEDDEPDFDDLEDLD